MHVCSRFQKGSRLVEGRPTFFKIRKRKEGNLGFHHSIYGTLNKLPIQPKMSVPEDRIPMVGSEELEEDFEGPEKSGDVDKKGVGMDFTRKFSRPLSGGRHSGKIIRDRNDEDIGDRRDQHEVALVEGSDGESTCATDALSDGAPPEWALLLVGCLLGLTTGVCVAAFNHVVSGFVSCSFSLRKIRILGKLF